VDPPQYFATEDSDEEMMTAAQLRRTVEELASSGFNYLPQQVALHRKVAFPFVTFVMTLLAVPFGVTTGRRGALSGIGLGAVIALLYWLVMSVFIAMGKAGLLTPVLAAWTPNIIVTACAAYLTSWLPSAFRAFGRKIPDSRSFRLQADGPPDFP
jgi:lipopolysaccharide export LptBFGC system permease protein LptF